MKLLSMERESIVEAFNQIKPECFVCKKIAKKLEDNKDIEDHEYYHLTVDLAAIKEIRPEGSITCGNQ